MDPSLASTAQIISLLKFAIEEDDDFWKELPPFSRMKGNFTAAQLLMQFMASYKRRYGQLCRELEQQAAESLHKTMDHEPRVATNKRVQKHKDAAAKLPGLLVEQLQENKERLLNEVIGRLSNKDDDASEPSGSAEASLPETVLPEPLQIRIDVARMGSVEGNVFNIDEDGALSEDVLTEMRNDRRQGAGPPELLTRSVEEVPASITCNMSIC
jgi:hypothetical protein